MPDCDSCGTPYLSRQRHCPDCGKLVNPSAQVWVTGDHPKPKTPKSSYRGSPEPMHDSSLEGGGLPDAWPSAPPRAVRKTALPGKDIGRKGSSTVGPLVAPVNRFDQSWTSAYIDLDTRDRTKNFFVVLEDGSQRVLWKSGVFPEWAMKQAHIGKGPRQIHRALVAALQSEGLIVSHLGKGPQWYKARVRRASPTRKQAYDRGVSGLQQSPGGTPIETPTAKVDDQMTCLDANAGATPNSRSSAPELQAKKRIRLVRLSLNQMRFEFQVDGTSKVFVSETFPNAHLVEYLGKRFMGHKNLASIYSNFRTNLDARGLLQNEDISQTLLQIVADFRSESIRGSD